MVELNRHVYGILLAGGAGTRLWPVSRSLFPKQLVKFAGNDSLIQTTIRRLTPVLDPDRIRVVCGEAHAAGIERHLSEIGLPSHGRVIAEPCGRNTAPAILLSVLLAMQEDEDAVLCIFPADHVIRPDHVFHARLREAVSLAHSGSIVTFGIRPTYPETGYGYIEGADPVPGGALTIKRFVEKPDEVTAGEYVASGRFFWNSGMFVFKASAMVAEFRSHEPDMLRRMEDMCGESSLPSATAYAQLPNISIDYAIMERTRQGVLLPSDFEWSDIGSWQSLYDFLPKDDNGNVVNGDVMPHDTRNSLIMGGERLIATNHISNTVIVDTPDALFVSDMARSSDVKTIVTRLKDTERREYVSHPVQHYPWGEISTLRQADGYCVDQVSVHPGGAYALALDDGTTSHLVVVDGEGNARNGNEGIALTKGVRLTASPTEPVTLENGGETPLVIIETRTKGTEGS